MITAKDVRLLARNVHTWNQVATDKQYALVWRAVVHTRFPTNRERVERRFLPDTKPEHVSWFIGGARFMIEQMGGEPEDEELAIEQV